MSTTQVASTTIERVHLRPMREVIKAAKALLEKADKSADKAEQFYRSLGLTLAELKSRKPKGLAWPDFLQKHKFTFGKNRADELIRIGTGATTVADQRDLEREGMKQVRAKRLPRGNQTGPDTPAPTPRRSKSPEEIREENCALEREQVTLFFNELSNFSQQFCGKVEQWVEDHPDLDDAGKACLMNILDLTSVTMQQLSQKIDGR